MRHDDPSDRPVITDEVQPINRPGKPTATLSVKPGKLQVGRN